jgi:hypothetical protein
MGGMGGGRVLTLTLTFEVPKEEEGVEEGEESMYLSVVLASDSLVGVNVALKIPVLIV